MQSKLLIFPPAVRLALLSGALAACSGEDLATDVGGLQSEIIRGEASDETEDHVVQLFTQIGTNAVQSCTGTLIAPDVLITALHCLAYTNEPGAQFTCRTDGTLKSDTPGAGTFGAVARPDKVKVFFGATYDPEPDAYGAKIFGSGSSVICRDDIAVVVLDRELQAPVAPLRFGRGVEYGDVVRVVGFGATDSAEESGRRRRDVPVTSVGSTLTRKGSATAIFNTFVTGEGPCHGDSGGPAFAIETGALVGVYSVNMTSCTDASVRNGYTQLYPFEDLVREAFAYAGREPVLEAVEGAAGAGGGSSSGGSTSGGSSTGGASQNGGSVGQAASAGEAEPDPGPDPEPDGDGDGDGDGDPGSGSRRDPSCTCSTIGERVSSPLSALGGLLLAALAVARRRQRGGRQRHD